MKKEYYEEAIGIIPAGGLAKRIAPLPCSKEIYPVGYKTKKDGSIVGPMVACQFLLEKMKVAGLKEVFIILREGKWDIPTYFGDGKIVDMNIAYLILGLPFGVPYTLDQAYPFVENAPIGFGFPDIMFDTDDAFVRLFKQLNVSAADAVLGIFPANRPEKVDLVDLDDKSRVKRIVIKPRKSKLTHTWGIAVWTPKFTRFMHDYLKTKKKLAEKESELFLGDVFQEAIHAGLKVEGNHVSKKPFLDIGTPEDLRTAIRRYDKYIK